MFNWWPLMWKKTHEKEVADAAALIKQFKSIMHDVNAPFYELCSRQATIDCDAVLKSAKARAAARKKPRSGKRITSGSKKRRR